MDIEWCVTLKVTLVSVELLNHNLYFSILISYAVYDNQSHYWGYLETSDYFIKQTIEKTKKDVERFNPTLIRIFKIMDATRLDFEKVLMNCQ